MSLIAYQGLSTLNSAVEVEGTDQWLLTISLSDKEGLVSPYTIEIGDYLVYDTSSIEPGTLAFYEILEVTELDWQAPTVRVQYLDFNNHSQGMPDLTWISGWIGIITRPSNSRKLLPSVSPDTQNVSDRLSVYIQNYNFNRIVDQIEKNTVNVNLFTAKRMAVREDGSVLLPKKPLGDFLYNTAIVHLVGGVIVEFMDVTYQTLNNEDLLILPSQDFEDFKNEIESVTVSYLVTV